MACQSCERIESDRDAPKFLHRDTAPWADCTLEATRQKGCGGSGARNRWEGLLPFVSLHQLTVDEDAVLHGPEAGEKQFPFLLNGHLMLLGLPDAELVSLGQIERE